VDWLVAGADFVLVVLTTVDGTAETFVGAET
jgi:hypothetical protein